MVAASADGNIDDPQWKWLEKELDAATERNELIAVFGHHATGSLTAAVSDEQASGCTEPDEHGHDTNPGCDRDPRASEPLHLGDDLKELLLAHPHVVAFVAGHSHNSRVAGYKAESGTGFWEIKTPAIADWPTTQRLIELMENCDGTLSIFGTLFDHDAAVEAPAPGPAADFTSAQLAAIGRVLAYNDPQEDTADNAGEPADRNVELLLDDPRATRPADPEAAAAGEAAAGSARRTPHAAAFRVRTRSRRARERRRRPLQGQAHGRRTRRAIARMKVRLRQGPARRAGARRRSAARSAGRASESPALARELRLAACAETSAPFTTSTRPPPKRRCAPLRSSTCAR